MAHREAQEVLKVAKEAVVSSSQVLGRRKRREDTRVYALPTLLRYTPSCTSLGTPRPPLEPAHGYPRTDVGNRFTALA